MKAENTAHIQNTHSSTALRVLEPRGAHIQLHDLLRWRLVAPLIPLENRNNSSQLTGNRRSTLRGRGIDFDEVRIYQPGDDVRTIDWRVTARTGKMHTKIFHEEKERPVILVIDLRSTMFFGSRRCFKSVVAANATALLAWTALAAGDRIGALLITDSGIIDIKPRRNRHTLLQIFRQIMTLDEQQANNTNPTESTTLWQHAMHQLRTMTRPGSCIIMLSDFHDWNKECQQALHPVVRHSQCFSIQIQDLLEKKLPIIGLVSLRAGLKKTTIDTFNEKLLARYQQTTQQQNQTIKEAMRALKIPLLALQTDAAIFSHLRQFFSQQVAREHHEQ